MTLVLLTRHRLAAEWIGQQPERARAILLSRAPVEDGEQEAQILLEHAVAHGDADASRRGQLPRTAEIDEAEDIGAHSESTSRSRPHSAVNSAAAFRS